MPDIIQLIAAWKKQIIIVVATAMIAAAAVVLIIPPQYLATATALPANPVITDKSAVFGSNPRELYSSTGSPAEIDPIVGTGQADTIYLAAARKFNLISFYKISDSNDAALLKAARILKKNTRITKSEYGELIIRVWCSDKLLAPQLANTLMDELAAIHQEILSRNNQLVLQQIKNTIDAFQTTRGLEQQDQAVEQLKQYRKLEAEYSIMINTRPPAIFPVEKARIGDQPDKPKKVLILIATLIVSFIFAVWLALLLEKRKTAKP